MLSLEYDHEVESTRDPDVQEKSRISPRLHIWTRYPNMLQLYITIKSRPYHYPAIKSRMPTDFYTMPITG
jgi:hypothetical protein